MAQAKGERTRRFIAGLTNREDLGRLLPREESCRIQPFQTTDYTDFLGLGFWRSTRWEGVHPFNARHVVRRDR